jgi:hypothetical protein
MVSNCTEVISQVQLINLTGMLRIVSTDWQTRTEFTGQVQLIKLTVMFIDLLAKVEKFSRV